MDGNGAGPVSEVQVHGHWRDRDNSSVLDVLNGMQASKAVYSTPRLLQSITGIFGSRSTNHDVRASAAAAELAATSHQPPEREQVRVKPATSGIALPLKESMASVTSRSLYPSAEKHFVERVHRRNAMTTLEGLTTPPEALAPVHHDRGHAAEESLRRPRRGDGRRRWGVVGTIPGAAGLRSSSLFGTDQPATREATSEKSPTPTLPPTPNAPSASALSAPARR